MSLHLHVEIDMSIFISISIYVSVFLPTCLYLPFCLTACQQGERSGAFETWLRLGQLGSRRSRPNFRGVLRARRGPLHSKHMGPQVVSLWHTRELNNRSAAVHIQKKECRNPNSPYKECPQRAPDSEQPLSTSSVAFRAQIDRGRPAGGRPRQGRGDVEPRF